MQPYTAATARRYIEDIYRLLFSLVHANGKSQQDSTTQYHIIDHQMEKKKGGEEELVGLLCVGSWTSPGLLIDEAIAHC